MSGVTPLGDGATGRRGLGALTLVLLAPWACATGSGTGPKERPASGPAPCERVECMLDEMEREDPGGPALPARWQVIQTESFRVMHFDAVLAREVAQAAEAIRRRQTWMWFGVVRPPWSPRCDVYLYPTNRMLVQMSGGDAKAGSAAAAPSRLLAGRMRERRINLAADDPRLTTGTLAHEISHVILAELMGQRPVPLWANEGLAMLMEEPQSQARYDAILAAHRADGDLLSVQAMLTLEHYPDGPYRSLFYAQALSLTRFFLGRGGRARLLPFLAAARPATVEQALREHYDIEGFLALQRLYLGFLERRGAAE